MRRRNVSTRASGRSPIAATGGMRDARIAGQSAAPTVTTKPTATASTTVRGSTTTSPLGMRNPRESTSDMSSRATTTPSSTARGGRERADDARLRRRPT